MTFRIVVGLDGTGAKGKALHYAEDLAKAMGDCELVLVYVIEWSPYTFQTPEENAERHKERESEISQATERVVAPAVAQAKGAGLSVRGIVQHGNVADTLNRIATEEGARQIVVARTDPNSLSERIFGSATSNLVMHASVPVTVVS
jgi:nucleotide-binding universal stress UspA family protein